MPTDRQYTGQINDVEIGLYFYQARYYDGALGRFIQADSIVPSPQEPQSYNRYAYTLNNPLKYTDPTGHLHFLATAAIGAVIGGGISIISQMNTALQTDDDVQTLGQAWNAIDPAKVIGATVAGAVAGATLGIVAPTVMGSVMPGVALHCGEASVATHLVGTGISVGAGGLAEAVGGQVGALSEGVWAGGGDLNATLERAQESGFGNWNTIQKDALVGGISGGIGYGFSAFNQATGLATKPNWHLQIHPDRISYAEQLLAPQTRGILLGADILNEAGGEFIENELNNGLEPFYQ